ncbi:MAG TPA: 2-polyprenylphenol 6-hydroxylase [Thermodesulfobacteriota bacterium]|nr:2-polyprenylphenol 6-hydroxylase [Thermodesulfobacteriota bacterium]
MEIRKHSTIKNINRLRQILNIFIRHGFGELVSQLHIFRLYILGKRFLTPRAEDVRAHRSTPERLRLALEELGPTFVKLGQLMSTRADWFPDEWSMEFKKLQDKVPPFPFEQVRELVEKELGKPLEEVYATFDSVPIASASIAQVHFATLKDGRELAVKVRRPEIEKVLDSDISIMYVIANLIVKYVPDWARYRPVEVVREFHKTIRQELDFTIEATRADRFRRNFKDDPEAYFPRVYWEYSSKKVMTMERIGGIPIDELEALKAAGFDLKEIAERGVRVFFRQALGDGFFHADMHPGNVFVGKKGEIIHVDFGIVGQIDDDLRNYLAKLLYYLIRRDFKTMALVHKEMGLIGPDVDIREFEDALIDIAEPIFGKSLSEINISALLWKLIETAKRFDMHMQPNLLLLQKSMVVIEGVGRELYPKLNVWAVARPFIFKLMKKSIDPKAAVKKGYETIIEMAEFTSTLPSQLTSVFNKVIKDRLRIEFAHLNLEELNAEIGHVGNRLVYGMIIASLVIGASLIVMAGKGPMLFEIPVVGLAGYGIAGILGLRLVIKK